MCKTCQEPCFQKCLCLSLLLPADLIKENGFQYYKATRQTHVYYLSFSLKWVGRKDGWISGVSGNSRSRSFPRMEASDSLPEFREWIFFIPFPFPNFGNGFFHSLPVPEFREWIFSIPFPFPNFGNGFFRFPSRSRILKSHSRSPLLVFSLLSTPVRILLWFGIFWNTCCA